MRVVALVLLSALSISGCETSPSQPEAVSLAGVSRDDYISVSSPLSFRTTGGAFGTTIEFGVLAGRYRAEMENELGVFYRGIGRPLWSRVVDNRRRPYQLRSGGIWVPKRKGAPPRLYWINEAELHEVETLDSGSKMVSNPTEDAIKRIEDRKQYDTTSTHKPSMATNTGTTLGLALVSAAIDADLGKVTVLEESRDPSFDRELLLGLHKSLAP